MAEVAGTTTDRFSSLRQQLADNLDRGEDVGASVTVIHHGEVVCDIWGGFRDAAKTVPWTSDTLVNVWSTTKTMTFVVMLMLVDRGELDVTAPVSTYWPEFAARGKADVEVRHLMNHTAGLSGWSESLENEDLADWSRCVEALADQEPWWTDRSRSGYHAITQGYLLGEVARRITGTSIGQFFKSEVADVLGADFFIGLPESEEHRVSVVIAPDTPDVLAGDRDAIAYRTFLSPPIDARAPEHRWWRAAEIPAANGHGNARSVATIQQIITNGGEANGHRFFRTTTCDKVFQPQVRGVDMVLAMDVSFGLGYGLASSAIPVGPRACYWGGFGGSVIAMDQDLGLTVAYMMNKMNVGLVGDLRGGAFALSAALAAQA
jgi:CubicO group peptidase (beta-lactamase class C family)